MLPSKDRSGGLPDEKLDSSDSEEEQQAQRDKKLHALSFNSPVSTSSNGDADVDVHTKEDNAMEIISAEKVDEDGNPLSDCKSLTFVTY